MAEVTSEGFTTSVQPLARMNGTRSQRMRKGKFQGVMSPTTPIGSRRTMPKSLSPRLLKLSPCSSRAAPAATSKQAMQWSISPRAWAIGLPFSSTSQ